MEAMISVFLAAGESCECLALMLHYLADLAGA